MRSGLPPCHTAPSAAPLGSRAHGDTSVFLVSPIFTALYLFSLPQVPGLNGPGLVPAKKKTAQEVYGSDFGGKTVTGDFDKIREANINHFWNPSGIVNSVPKVKGIITPKTPVK